MSGDDPETDISSELHVSARVPDASSAPFYANNNLREFSYINPNLSI